MQIIREYTDANGKATLVVGSKNPLPPTLLHNRRSYVKTPSKLLQISWVAENYEYLAMYTWHRPPSPYSDESEEAYDNLRKRA